MTQKSCAVGMRNAKLGNHLNTSNSQKTKIYGIDLPMTEQFKWVALSDVMAEQAQISDAV